MREMLIIFRKHTIKVFSKKLTFRIVLLSFPEALVNISPRVHFKCHTEPFESIDKIILTTDRCLFLNVIFEIGLISHEEFIFLLLFLLPYFLDRFALRH